MEKKDLTRELLTEKGMLDVSKYSQKDKKFYSSQKWQRERKKYKELHPFCEVCLKEKLQKPSEIVHHITPISQGGAPYDEKNLLAICKKCHGEVHTGMGIKIDEDFILNLFQMDSTPESEWWSSGLFDFYRGKEEKIRAMIKKAQILEGKDVKKSIDLYFKAIRLIDDYEKILSEDPLLKKAWCDKYNVSFFRYVRYPINRLSCLLEKSKRYIECIQLIVDYEKKDDKTSLLSFDLKCIEKRKQRILKKLNSKTKPLCR